MDDEPTLRQIKQGLEHLRQALEELESAMVEFEEKLSGESPVRPQERRGLELLSIPEVCQELGMGKSWLYRKLKSGEIPSIKLGSKIKIKRSALEEYLQHQVIQRPQDTMGQLTDQVQGTVGQVTGRVVHGAPKGAGGGRSAG
jgi:excisionase family DNA binding protein